MAGNEFKAPRKRKGEPMHDVRKRCAMFKMSAIDETDQIFLAHLYRTIWIHGGTVTIDDGETKQEYNFSGD